MHAELQLWSLASLTVHRYCTWFTYLPTLVFVNAGQFHSFCRILLSFAGQYDSLRLILSQILSSTKLRYYMVTLAPLWLPLACSLLGQSSETSDPLALILWLALTLTRWYSVTVQLVLTVYAHATCRVSGTVPETDLVSSCPGSIQIVPEIPGQLASEGSSSLVRLNSRVLLAQNSIMWSMCSCEVQLVSGRMGTKPWVYLMINTLWITNG